MLMYIDLCVHRHAYTYVCIYRYVHVIYTFVRVSAYRDLYMCMCRYITYTYARVYIYPYSHTCRLFQWARFTFSTVLLKYNLRTVKPTQREGVTRWPLMNGRVMQPAAQARPVRPLEQHPEHRLQLAFLGLCEGRPQPGQVSLSNRPDGTCPPLGVTEVQVACHWARLTRKTGKSSTEPF